MRERGSSAKRRRRHGAALILLIFFLLRGCCPRLPPIPRLRPISSTVAVSSPCRDAMPPMATAPRRGPLAPVFSTQQRDVDADY